MYLVGTNCIMQPITISTGLDGDFTLWKKGLMRKLKRVLRGKDIHSCEGGACSGKCGCTKKDGDGQDKHCSSDEDNHSHSEVISSYSVCVSL